MSRISRTVLRSGVPVITEQMPDSRSSSIGVWIKVGSRNETEKLSGISHLIEHMFFKGTKKRSAYDISREIESVGGVLNAFTSREYTCLYAKVLNRDLPRAVDILSDIFTNPRFDPKELAREKMVVRQEIKLAEDTPDDLIHDLYASAFFRDHPLGRSILGTVKTVSSIKRRDILSFYRALYPSSVFISAAGGVGHERILNLVRPVFGHITKKTAPVDVEPPGPTPGVTLIERDLGQVHICLGVPVPPQPDPGRYRVYLLNTILGSGMSSRLFQKIREKRGLVYSVYSYLSLFRDSGTLVVYAGTTEENFSRVVNLILKEFKDLGKGIEAGELRDARSHLKGSMFLGLEASDNRMAKLAKDEIYFGRVVPVKDIERRISRVRAADVVREAKRLLVPEKTTLVALGRVRDAGLPESLRKTVR